MNKDTKKDLPYLSQSTYQGKDKLYNVIKINIDRIDKDIGLYIKTKLCEFYETNLDKKLGGNENNVFNLSQVTCLEPAGLSAILVFNRLNQQKYDGKNITIISNQERARRLLEISGIDSLIEVLENITDL